MESSIKMIHGKKIFITGGAGFIATGLIKRLVADNQIIVYDNFSRNSLKDSGIWGHDNLHIIKGDILDYNYLRASIPKDVNLILHFAAIAGIYTVVKDPMMTLEVDMLGTYHLLKAIKELDIIPKLERFINFSTSEVYGTKSFRVDEKMPMSIQPVGEARWNYSVGKVAGEYFVYNYYKKFGLPGVSIHPFHIYGTGQIGEGAIHNFVVQAIKNEDLIIHGEGDQIRSWCYIDDMVDGILLCLEKEEAIGTVFNVGNPSTTITILGLAEKVVQIAKSNSRIVHTPRSYAEVEMSIPNIDKARRILGFSPKIDLNEGIRRTIEWYKNRV